MTVRLSKTFRFEAAHYLPTLPEGHKCRRMLGHSFVVDVVVEGPVDEEKGYLLDYGRISQLCEPIRERLDHYLLNEIEGLENPTAEILAGWIWRRLVPGLDSTTERADGDARLVEVVVRETCTSACHYDGA